MPRSTMGPIHEICARVQILPRDGEAKNPEWDDEKLHKIVLRSPFLERHINRLKVYKQYVWTIKPEEDADGFDDSAVVFLFNNVGRPNDRVANPTDAQGLSRYCNVLWHFQIDPSRFNVPTRITNTSGEEIAQHISVTPLTSSSVIPIAGEPIEWCWNREPTHPSPETSLFVANTALVLGWEEVFQREIKTVIWDWPARTRVGIKTPISRLRDEGAEGLNQRREQERKAVIDWFGSDTKNNPKLFKDTAKRLQSHLSHPYDLSEPPCESVYKWVKSLQALLLNHSSSTSSLSHHDPKSMPIATNETSPSVISIEGKDTNRGAAGKSHRVFRKLTIRLSGLEDEKLYLQGMFLRAHNFIEKRQTEVAKEMMDWRNAQVAEWEKVLEEALSGGIASTLSPPGNGAAG